MRIGDEGASEGLYRPLFLGRAILYSQGVLLTVGLAIAGDAPVPLPRITAAVAITAWLQSRSVTLRPAWALDLVFSVVGLAWVGHSMAGFAIVAGWGGLIGFVRVRQRWLYSAGTGIAAELIATIVSLEYVTLASSHLNGVGAASITAFLR